MSRAFPRFTGIDYSEIDIFTPFTSHQLYKKGRGSNPGPPAEQAGSRAATPFSRRMYSRSVPLLMASICGPGGAGSLSADVSAVSAPSSSSPSTPASGDCPGESWGKNNNDYYLLNYKLYKNNALTVLCAISTYYTTSTN